MYAAEILADSLSPDDVRLTTMRLRFPRFVLAELNTHRLFSRNAASSRAIQIHTRIAEVIDDPVCCLRSRLRKARCGPSEARGDGLRWGGVVEKCDFTERNT